MTNKTVNVSKEKLEKLIKELEHYLETEEKMSGALAGISIALGQTGEILYEHMGNIRLQPASNMKLLTAASALEVLGEDYVFKTKMLTDGDVHHDTLYGNIYLQGQGDPTILPTDLDQFVLQLKDKGIKKIFGHIIADDTWYDEIRLSTDMIWSDEQWYYGSQISALTVSPTADYDTGSVKLTIKAGECIGDRPFLTLYPHTNYVKVMNQAVTTDETVEEDDLIIERKHGSNTIIIKGKVNIDSEPRHEWIAVWEPSYYTLKLFQETLFKHGIKWTGQMRRDKTPETAQLLYQKLSPPLKKLLIPFMKLSNNGLGEMFVKEMGKVVHHHGSWEKGLEVLKREVQLLGVNTNTCIIKDGSGISHITSIPANELIHLLFNVQSKPWFTTFLESLPVSGKRDRMEVGTLIDRNFSAQIIAKTGTLNCVSTLSGYLPVNNNLYLFSILLNNLLDEEDGKRVEEDILNILIRHLKNIDI